MLLFSISPVIGIALATVALAFAWRILNNVIFSPLRDIPGPLLAKITGKWLVFVDLAGDRTSTIHQLHKKYGSAVRIGPKEITFSSIECAKEIYGQQTVYMKAPVYDTFSLKPLGIFSMRGKQEHSQRRRLLSHAFSQSNLYESEPLIMEQINKFLRHVETHIKEPINVFIMFRMLALDVVGELFLGKTFGTLDSDQPPAFLHDADKHFLLSGLDASFPWVYKTLSCLPIPALQHFFASRERISKYGHDAFNSYIQRHGRKSNRRDLLTKILDSESHDKESSMSDVEIYVEIGNLVFAGTDTTSTTLTYLFWELTQNLSWQKRLRTELVSTLPAELRTPLSYRNIMELPVLDAIVNESLRMHPAAPASLQRITPSGGRTLGGLFVPENTVVSMQCYTTQRDPSVFPNPETFDPERWLAPDAPTNDMKELFMPFSRGTRGCLGKSLALMELKLITAALIQRYVVVAAQNMLPTDMEMKDHFLALPKGGRCDLVFSNAE